MTTHARALDLAAGTPAFRLDPAEDHELHGHLRTCAECAHRVARLGADAAAIGRIDPPLSPGLHDRLREVAVTAPRSGPSLLGIVVLLSLLAVGVVGASIGVGGFLAAKPQASFPAVVADANDAVHWQTDVVALAATEFRIEANGLTFHGVPGARVDSDPGNFTSWTIEASWQEQGREQRLSLYFAADDTSWWIDEVRTYDGAASGPKWASFAGGPWSRTANGATFSGDLDLTGTSATGPVRLHLGGLRIAVRPDDHITAPLGGGIYLQELPGDAGNPARPGGALYCTGILQLPPRAAEPRLLALGYRLSWRWQYSTGGNTGYSEIRDMAPDTGWISDAGVGSSGELIVFVQDPANPFRQGDPPGRPTDCPTPAP